MTPIRWLVALAFLTTPLALAQQPPIAPFTRPVNTPVIRPNPSAVFTDPITKAPTRWEALHTFNPAAIVRDNKVFVLYRAEDNTGSMSIGGHTSRLGLAQSSDGIHFTTLPSPVFYAANDDQKSREWPGGVEDPRLVESPEGLYILTYTQWNTHSYSVGIATSRDLQHWTKYGPAFGSDSTGRYQQLNYKSAGIVTERSNGRLIAAKLHGKYWMFWGEVVVHLATSTDLIHWTPVEDKQGEPIQLLTARPGLFDSGFPETGPPPVLTDQGIVLIYNGKNASSGNDASQGPGAYSAGEAIFSADNPAHLIARFDKPILKPEKPYEKTGQYAAGTTFAEGLVLFHDKWFLYYGCADSFVSVATAPAQH